MPRIFPGCFPGLPAANIEPILGAAQCDIEQTAIFLQVALAQRPFFARIKWDGEIGPRTPQRQPLTLRPQQRVRQVRQLHSVGQKDHRRFEPLRAMNRQCAHLVALPCAEIALDFGVAGDQPAQKTLQGRHMLAFVGECQC